MARSVYRVQLATMLRIDIYHQLRDFVKANHTSQRAVIEAALAEYIDRHQQAEEHAKAA